MLDEVRMWPVIGGVLSMLWIFVRDVPLAAGSIAGELLIGGMVGMSIAYLFRHMYTDTINLHHLAAVTPYAAAYLNTFVRDLVSGNIAVMRLVLSPRMPIRPAVVEIPLRVRSDAAITLIANSITLTPGTLTMDYDAETNALYVHAITGQDRDAVVRPIRRWEELALLIFGEEQERVVQPVYSDPVTVPEVNPEVA